MRSGDLNLLQLKNNGADFAGEKKYYEVFRMRKNFKLNFVLVVVKAFERNLLQSCESFFISYEFC